MTLRALLSTLFAPAALHADLAAKNRQLAENDALIRKLGITALNAMSRARLAESQLAELRIRVETMTLVHPWLDVKGGFDA